MAVDALMASTLGAAPVASKPTAEVMKAAKEFESLVIGQMLQPMFNGLDADGMFGGGEAEKMFRPMLVEEYAKAMSKNGGIGIADSVAREMMKLQMGGA